VQGWKEERDWIVGVNLRGDDEEWARRRAIGAIGDMKISKSVKEKLGSLPPKTPSQQLPNSPTH